MRLVPERGPLPRLLAFPLAAIAAAGAAACLVAPGRLEHLAFCPLRRLAGLPCPTCGGTGAALALARLQLGQALACNPLLTVAALGTGAWMLYAVAATLRPGWRRSLAVEPREARLLRIGAAAGLLLGWAWQVARAGGG